jgi:acetyl esterase/lipase
MKFKPTFILIILFSLFCSAGSATSLKDSILVQGKILNASEERIQLGEQVEELDEQGNFSFSIPVKEPTYLGLKYQDLELDLFAEPGKDIQLEFDENNPDHSLQFSGENAAVNSFLFRQQEVSSSFNEYFGRNVNHYLSKLPEQEFLQKMDSLKSTFLTPLQELKKEHPGVSSYFTDDYQKEIELLFLSFLADYPLWHLKNTGEETELSAGSKHRLEKVDHNDASLLKYDGFQRLLKNFLYVKTNEELEKNDYAGSNNKRLDAGFAVIEENFSNQQLFDKVLFDWFMNHIDNLGVKNTADNLEAFINKTEDLELQQKITQAYAANMKRREGHLIVPYKSLGDYSLDAHIFMPDSFVSGKKYPVIAMFHGGSFFEGKPDWFFSSAKDWAKKGWIAVAVEYRLADRHNSLLPESISDGKSLVRFLRKNAEKYQIDPEKILVTGNSSGATISLALATIGTELDEENEDLNISSRPNAAIINAGLADLTEDGHYWWHKYYDQEFIEAISPLHQVKKDLPPMLIFHGNKDHSVCIDSIKEFARLSKGLGNDVEFVELKGAPHMIWRIPYFSRQMVEPKKEFLQFLNW